MSMVGSVAPKRMDRLSCFIFLFDVIEINLWQSIHPFWHILFVINMSGSFLTVFNFTCLCRSSSLTTAHVLCFLQRDHFANCESTCHWFELLFFCLYKLPFIILINYYFSKYFKYICIIRFNGNHGHNY